MINLFENKKYVSKKTIEKLKNNGFITNCNEFVKGYSMTLGNAGSEKPVIRQMNAVIVMQFTNCDMDAEELHCILLKSTYKITGCFINGISQKKY